MTRRSPPSSSPRCALRAAGLMGLPGGPLPFFETKVACDELAAFVTAEAFAKRLPFELYFRDARAGMLMGIAHDVAVQNIGRLLFPKPKEDRG